MDHNHGYWIIMAVAMITLVTIGESKLVDMTHYMNKEAKHYQLFRDFETKAAVNQSMNTMWVYANEIAMNEHTGTHIDAPAHTHLGARKLHEISIQELMGPAVVFDLTEKAKTDPDYALTVEDIKAHEAEHGQIVEGSVIFINTGGCKVYWDRNAYFGSETPEDSKTIHYPGFGGPATDFLIRDRKIKGIGTDRMSFDVGKSHNFPAHYSVSTQDTWGLENVNRVDELPIRGATVFVMPILLENGSGGPSRVIAYTDIEDVRFASSSSRPGLSFLAGLMAVFFMVCTLI